MKKVILLFVTSLIFQTTTAGSYADSLRLLLATDTLSSENRLDTYRALGDYFLRVDFDSARQAYQKGFDYSIEVDNFRHQSVFKILHGATYYYQGDYHITAKYWLDALKISENASDTTRIEQALNNLGILYKSMDEWELSMDYFRKSLNMKLRYGNPHTIAITRMNIGVLHHRMNRHDSAFIYLTGVVDTFKEVENMRALAFTYNNLGSVHLALKNYSLALENYEKAHELKDHLSMFDQATLLMNKGSILIHYLNDPEQGSFFLDESFEIAKANSLLKVKQNIHEVYSYYYYLKGDYLNAYEYLEKHAVYKDSLFNFEKDAEIKRLQAVYDIEKKEQENLALSQQMEILNQQVLIKELESLRRKRASQFMLFVIIVGIIALVIFAYLFIKVKRAKNALEAAQAELKNSNIKLKKAKEATEQALEFKSQFLANMSHEVRTPLNVIIGFNSNLKRKLTDPKLIEFVQAIEVSSYNLLNLLNDVLDMSKIEAGKVILNPVNTNLKLLIAEIHAMFRLRAAEKNIDFEFQYQPGLHEYFHLDQVLLRQIIVNIAGNAIKFTHRGYVQISVAEEEKRANQFASSLKNLCITIEDTGIGIKPEDQEHIFDSFVQAKGQDHEKYGGTGLGLAISQKFAKLMGGEIILESVHTKGSTFRIYLRNVSLGQPEAIEPVVKTTKKLAAPDIVFTGGTLLVADDERLNRNMIKSFFEETPVEVFEAENGKELIEKARQCNPTVILSDIKMPYMDGIEAAKAMKSDDALKEIPIIAFTASILFPKMDPSERSMFSGYLPKPAEIDELFVRLAEYLPTEKPVNAEVGGQ